MSGSWLSTASVFKITAALLYRNIGWKLLALLLGTLVWIAVYREPEMAAVVAARSSSRTARRTSISARKL